jgi:hypothetical protein
MVLDMTFVEMKHKIIKLKGINDNFKMLFINLNYYVPVITIV